MTTSRSPRPRSARVQQVPPRPIGRATQPISRPRACTANRLLPLGALLSGMALSASAAAQEEVTAPRVDVEAARERESYQLELTSVGKLQQAPRDIPQSLTVIPESVYRDRGNASLQQALGNAPGITFAAGEGGRIGDNFSMRGFPIYGDLYLDGMRDVAQYNRDLFNLQQIDVLRGSASMLFGRGSTGGVVNQVSKQPMRVDEYEASVTLGSYGYSRATVDLNKAVGDSSGLRVNAMAHDADSFRGEGPHYERWGVAPAFPWGLGTQLELGLSYFDLNEENVPDFGVPYFQRRPLDVPVDRFYGFANDAYERYETGIATASVLYRFSPDVSLRTVGRRPDNPEEQERGRWNDC